MHLYLNIAQLGTAVLLVTSIMLQSRGTGMGSTFGGEGNVYRTKRGVEKTLFVSTIAFSVIFFGLAIANIVLPAA
jgi:preprotein translocase subunit SecG